MFYATVVGNYPRPSWLREALLRIEGKQKKAGESEEKVKQLYGKATREVIGEFESCGVDLLSDGQLRWTDSLASFCENLNGFRMTGLIRFYDNNFYYRQPEAVEKLSWRQPAYVEDFHYARECTKKPIKWALPGPYTLARLCKNSCHQSFGDLMFDLASALSNEAKALEKAGCGVIQIDEPSLVCDEKLEADIEKIMEALASVESGVGCTTMLYTYFGGFGEQLAPLLDSGFDVLGFDLVDGKANQKFIEEHGVEKDVALGVVDARNVLLEKPQKVRETVGKVMENADPKNIYLNPSWGLELIPREYAVKKLKLVSEVALGLREGSK